MRLRTTFALGLVATLPVLWLADRGHDVPADATSVSSVSPERDAGSRMQPRLLAQVETSEAAAGVHVVEQQPGAQ